MKRLIKESVQIVGGLIALLAATSGQAADQAAEEALIRNAVEAYVVAFNTGDAKALAQFWSPEAVYINPLSGAQVVGREAIEEQFAAIFSDAKNAQLEAMTDAIQFISPNVAVEQGTATLTLPEQPPEETEYTAVYVKRDGQWLLDRVTEKEVIVPLSHYDQLKELEWLVGTWLDEDDNSRIETTCHWAKNQNFLVRSFTLAVRDQVEMAGMQFIGWDPAAKQIRSWVFDSDGGFGQGIWSKNGDAWYIRTVGTAPGGSKSSSTNILTRINDNTFTWQSINRVAGDDLLPNVDEVVVVRQP